MEAPKSKSVGARLLDILFGEKVPSEEGSRPVAPKPRLVAIYMVIFFLWLVFMLACVTNYFVALPYVGGWFSENGRSYMSWGNIVLCVVLWLLSRKPRRHGDDPTKAPK
ncbi:MAG: hypothetical protein ACT6RD_08280 [Brevundimonas sp.]|uniref:hypothetical protein n=1 Tax=Brevundimonas sp. TaxID=1871086 RepID=UPI0040335E9A